MLAIEPAFAALTTGLDVAAFWEENRKCEVFFTTKKPRCSASFSPDDHWLFEFLAVPSTVRYYRDKAYRDDRHRRANQLTRPAVGKAFFSEDTWEHQPKRLENLFGCEFAYHEGGTPWLVPATNDPAEFARVLDRAEATDLKTWALPEPYLQEVERRRAAGQPQPRLGGGSRGPATVMTSILAPETFFYWVYDHPELIQRFRDVLAVKYVEFNRVLREWSGNTQPGWGTLDDNCALFNEELYREYCLPILDRVMNEFAPGDSRRYQHSDSDMGHLLDAQAELGMNHVNYGPNVDAALIRAKLPAARIDGQLPPFLLRNGTPVEIRHRIAEDFQKAGSSGGLHVATAGSLAAGTGLGRMRWFMQCVQEVCRYD